MSDKAPDVAPCHASSDQSTPCRCCSHHRITINQLQAELDAERAAAATGASDWIDMIRRLQRERSDAMLELKRLRRVSEDQEEQMSRVRAEKEALEEGMREKDERIVSLRNENEERRKAFDDLPQWIKHTMRLKKEREEKEQKKNTKAEAYLYTIIKVARDEDFCEQIGKNIYFDLVDHDKVHCFRVQNQLPFTAFKEEVAKEFGIPVQFQRYWLWGKRQNRTYRPLRPLTAHEEVQTVSTLRAFSKTARNAELKLFLEVELGPDLSLLPPPNKSKKDILIFFKLYDPEKEELSYVGRMFVKEVGKPQDILVELNELAGFPENEDIDLFEEIKFVPNIMCEPIDKRISFRKSQLGNGDIICFQKAISDSETNYRYPDVPSFLEYVRNHIWKFAFISANPPEYHKDSDVISSRFQIRDVYSGWEPYLGLDHSNTTQGPLIANQS